MAKKNDDVVGKVILGLLGLAAAIAVIHAQTGQGEEKNSAVIPDGLERYLDNAVMLLNAKFGHGWVTAGEYALRMYLRTMPQLAALVGVLVAAENAYKHLKKSGALKKQFAIQMARQG